MVVSLGVKIGTYFIITISRIISKDSCQEQNPALITKCLQNAKIPDGKSFSLSVSLSLSLFLSHSTR